VPSRLSFSIGLVAFLVFIGFAVIGSLLRPVPGPHDEWQHLSYAAAVQQMPSLRFHLESQYMLAEGRLDSFGSEHNYMPHPAPYYAFVSLFLDRGRSLHEGVVIMRLASLLLFAASIALVLSAGWHWFGSNQFAWPGFCALVVLCPKLLLVAQQVTNDALAIFASGLAYWGATRLGRTRSAEIALGFSLALAGCAKLSALILLGIWTAALFLGRPSRRLFGALALGGVTGALPYLDILFRYGRLVPITWEEASGFTKQPLPLSDGLHNFLRQYPLGWSVNEDPSWLISIAFAALIVAMLAGAWLGWRCREDLAGLIAAGVGSAYVLGGLIQLGFTLGPLAGSAGGAAFRYSLPLWPMLAHALALLIRDVHMGAWLPRSLLVLILLSCIGGLLT
jgi:hypothetical protein